jgi:GNAT superfamily N-acetyltransferase
MDSYMEDNLDLCKITSIHLDQRHVGFAGLQDDAIWFFHIQRPWLKHAQAVFGALVESRGVKSIYFQTSDELMTSLATDWEFKKEKAAFFFQDAVRLPPPRLPYPDTAFRQARPSDAPRIAAETGAFFETLDRDIELGRAFMLLSRDTLLGCGLIVPGRYFTDCASMGMITVEKHRRRGIGRAVVWHLKEWCYLRGLRPLAGCAYGNALSRLTLESAGMVTRARGIRAWLLGRETPPEKTVRLLPRG